LTISSPSEVMLRPDQPLYHRPVIDHVGLVAGMETALSRKHPTGRQYRKLDKAAVKSRMASSGANFGKTSRSLKRVVVDN
jgi:hypothetical protein